MIHVLRIAHLRIATQEGKSEVGNCEVHQKHGFLGYKICYFLIKVFRPKFVHSEFGVELCFQLWCCNLFSCFIILSAVSMGDLIKEIKTSL